MKSFFKHTYLNTFSKLKTLGGRREHADKKDKTPATNDDLVITLPLLRNYIDIRISRYTPYKPYSYTYYTFRLPYFCLSTFFAY